MSDLQIFTGLSILISGLANLRCGLSCYHWQVMVYLAWFSTLTHLSCLTVLRNQLCVKKGERAWRILGMAAVLIMLLVAMVPTGNYDWIQTVEPTPAPRDYAYCYFHVGRRDAVDEFTYASMVTSTIILSLAFATRVVKVYKVLSVDIVKRGRDALSLWLRGRLLKYYIFLGPNENPRQLSKRQAYFHRVYIYRPALAVFLLIRFISDAWVSMLVEVSRIGLW